MSSTEPLSLGNIHMHSADTGPVPEKSSRHDRSWSRTRQSKTKSRKHVSQETMAEIGELIDDVPQLGEVFNITDKIGSGAFSSVYLAQLKNCPATIEKFALKHIIPTSHPSRIESELRCLQEIGGQDNVIGAKACVREKDHVVIVMPYFPHDSFQDYVQMLTVSEVQSYMKNLLLALRRVHQVDIIHRDIKPTNFLYNRKLKKFALVDFGLAQQAPVALHCKAPASDAAAEVEAEALKSSTSSSLTTAFKDVPLPLSPKRTNVPDAESKVCLPRKRKADPVDVENFPESPRKKCLLGERPPVGTGLGQLGPGTLRKALVSPVVKLHKLNSRVLTPPIGLDNPAYLKTAKSPRRALLTKRALDLQKVTEDVWSRTAAAPTVKVTRPGASVLPRHPRKTVVVEKNGRQMFKTLVPAACQCYGKAVICSICTTRSPQTAPRAGTSGFRAPEVLMKCPGQTTAVDIWSAGVIFLSLLSGRYPFFKSDDDFTALAQIMTVFGTENVRAAAKTFGKALTCSPEMLGFKLKTVCARLRGASCSSKIKVAHPMEEDVVGLKQQTQPFPDSAFDLLERLLDLNPSTRITACDALNHPFLAEV